MARKAAQFYARTAKALLSLGQLRFITLTLPSPVQLTQDEVRRLRRHLKALKQHPFIKARLGPHVYAIEATPKLMGWHLHIHILAAGKFIPQQALSAIWKQLTGASIVHIRAVKSPKSAVNEIIKYIHKPAGFDDPTQRAQYAIAMRGVHAYQCCGGLHQGPDESAQVNCPVCGAHAWHMMHVWSPEDYEDTTRFDLYAHPAFLAIQCLTHLSTYWPCNFRGPAEPNFVLQNEHNAETFMPSN